MSRWAVIAIVIAGCSCSKKQEQAPAVETGRSPGLERIEAPREGGATEIVDDPAFHLKDDEGTLTIDKGEAKAGNAAVANVKVTPASGFHVATDFKISLALTPPDGVKLEKATLTAGGRDKAQGDAQTLSEQQLAFAIKATADKAGAYEIKGWFKFGVCDKDSCHPKRQPITIQVAAN